MTTDTPNSTLTFSRETFAKLSPHPYLLAHLQPHPSTDPPTRPNGRHPSEFRPPHINSGSLTHAEGSAVVRMGDTTVVCGVRGEILLASEAVGFRADRSAMGSESGRMSEAKELDLLVPNIELSTGCSPGNLPGQAPSATAQSFATRLYSLLHSSCLVDGEDLRIWWHPPNLAAEGGSGMDDVEGDEEAPAPEIKAFWTLYIDVLVISLDGNVFDAAWAAILAALRDVRLPKAYWDVDREGILCSDLLAESEKLNLKALPIAVSFAVFREREQTKVGRGREEKSWLLADPDAFEEGLCDESVTVVVDCSEVRTGKLLGISKAGGTLVDRVKMRKVVELAVERWGEWEKVIRGSP